MNASGIQTITLTDAKNAALTGLKIYGLSDGGYHGGETDWIQNVGDSGSINFTIEKVQTNLCPVNNISVETSEQVKFGKSLPAGTYTISGIIASTDTDASQCLILFYYDDSTTKEVNIGRSVGNERVSVTTTLDKSFSRIRVYAGESYATSSGDTATYSDFMVEAGSSATEYEAYISPQTFSVSTPTGHVGLILESGGNYQIQGIGVLGNVIDFGTGKNTAYVNKEIIVNTPNFVGAPLNAEDTRPHAVWDNAVGNTYKDHTHGALYSFAHYQNPEDEPDNFEGTYICLNGNQIEGYIPEAMSITGMTSDILASGLNAAFTEGQAGAIPFYFIGQLANPIESNISADLMEAFSQLTTSEGTTVITADQMVYFEVEYQKIGEDPEPEPEPEEDSNEEEVILYLMTLCGKFSVSNLPTPTCRIAHLFRKLLDPNYIFPASFMSTNDTMSRAEVYIWDLINGTNLSSNMEPLSDFERYLALKTGRGDVTIPDPYASKLNQWMNEWVSKA